MKRSFRIGFFMILLSCAVADSKATPWAARHGMTSSDYQSEFNKYTAQGFRLTYVSGYSVNGSARYAAIWEKSSGPAWIARHGMTSSQYQGEFSKHTGQGYRLVLVNGYTVNNQDRYVAIWEKSSGPEWVARHGMTPSQYQIEFNKYTSQGYRLSHLSGYSANGRALYAAIWEKKGGPAWVAKHGLTSSQYQAEFNNLIKQGYRLSHVSGYSAGDDARYAAIWEKNTGPTWAARHGMTSQEYQGEFNNYFYQGYRPKLVCGYAVDDKGTYAAIWEGAGMNSSDLSLIDNKIQGYMKKHNIPGLSIAVTKQGRLVFAKGYGYADIDKPEKVNPAHLFRIASVSKPVTAVAVMKLIDDGKLLLDSKVFGPGGVLGNQYGTKPYSDRVKKITVKHLLEHTSGWSNDGGDPMFSNPGFNHSQLITWVLDNRPVKNEPAAVYEYLNFGYCVLGRIIEKVSGQSYEAYLRSNILSNVGVSKMEIAGDTLAERKPDEVVYYGANPYGMKVARMDSHGGWIATPIDLLRLLVRTDGFATKPDILKPGTISTMFASSSANTGYGKGWIVDGSFKGHNGAFPGAIGFAVIRSDGFCFAVSVNTRPAGDSFAFEAKGILDDIVKEVSKWPAYDLF